MGQCWETGRKITDQIINNGSCHFYSCFAKKNNKNQNKNGCVLCLYIFFPLSCLCKPERTDGMYRLEVQGKNINAFFLCKDWRLTTLFAVTLQSKSFKWDLMWNSVIKYNFNGSLICLKAVFCWTDTGFSSEHHIFAEITSVCVFDPYLDPLEPALYGWDGLLRYIM